MTIYLDLDDVLLQGSLSQKKIEYKNIERLKFRRRQVQCSFFIFSSFSDQQCVADYRFKKCDIIKLSTRLDWCEVEALKRYQGNPLTAICSLLYRLATNCGWYDHERKFGMFSTQLSEIFWKNVDLVIDMFMKILKLLLWLLRDRSEKHSNILHDQNAPLDRVLGFIY